ncbi:hypothetical protein LZ554_007523 [Drepanopeziza brunnea f. sp. 'monogermtubi']|nr:hypothetical protein LZ554_007523 [Drepanopeziza brunnea f. sp. 'monogermtubi']
MSRKLKPLLLPQLVEERRRKASLSDPEIDLSSASFHTQNSSSVSETPSPVTPTFSTRSHLRYPSTASISSVESSPTSPTFVGNGTPSKRSLPDVQEEPQEREGGFDIFGRFNPQWLCDDQQCLHRDPSMVQSSVQLSARSELDYDLAGDFFNDGEFTTIPRNKSQRGEESPFAGFATRFGTRFPSFSRKWKTRKGSLGATSTNSESQMESATSRGASSRSSSVSNLPRQAVEKACEPPLPPTPTRSDFNDWDEMPTAVPIDIVRANMGSKDHEEELASTPLLPPLTMDASANTKQVSVQSPLQSPSVAEASDPFACVSPIDSLIAPCFPSPSLSTKPSISSFHRGTTTRPGHFIPLSEIPPIIIADPNDEWANKLGHANFTIYPEPYVPESFDLEACRQLRKNWDLARCNYTKHLVRTGEHYGVTSKTYRLTESKWEAIDATWRRSNEITIANTIKNGSEAFVSLKHATLDDGRSPNIMTQIPSLNDPRSEGKFPQLGDEDIVGPMVQATAQLRRSPSKKEKLFKFLVDRFPVGLGRA